MTEIRLAFRQFVRAPLIPATIVLLLALGVSLNAALFSVIDGLLFRPLPFPETERLVAIDAHRVVLASYGRSREEREALRAVLEATPLLSARGYASSGMLLDSGSGEVNELGLVDAAVTPGFFETFGVKPHIGRLLDDNDDRQPDPQAILIGYDLWRSRFGADPSIVGRRVSLATVRFLKMYFASRTL